MVERLDPTPEITKPTSLQLFQAKQEEKKLFCGGFDSNYDYLPQNYKLPLGKDTALTLFNLFIFKNTHDQLGAVKLNSAFFEGEKGRRGLFDAVAGMKEFDPTVPIISDAKIGDVGTTCEQYAKFYYDELKVDALTLNGYGGVGSLEPFLQRKDKMNFIWCKSSNMGGYEIQNIPVVLKSNDYLMEKVKEEGIREQLTSLGYPKNTVPFFLNFSHRIASEWSENGNVGLVMGATYPKELGWVRKVVGDMQILTPGIGSQQANLEATIREGLNSKRQGLIFNSSSAFMYMGAVREDYSEHFAKSAHEYASWVNEKLKAAS